MRVKYRGAHDAVEITLPSGAVITAHRDGEPITVPFEIGLGLLEQVENWQPTNKEAREAARSLSLALEEVNEAEPTDPPPLDPEMAFLEEPQPDVDDTKTKKD